jgi:hypothetical protein
MKKLGSPSFSQRLAAVYRREFIIHTDLWQDITYLNRDRKLKNEVIVEYATYLETLICGVSHSGYADCDDGAFHDSPVFTMIGTTLAKQMSQLASVPISEEVWVSVLKMLNGFAKHGRISPDHSQPFFSFTRQCFLHKSRSVRIAAA